MALRHDLKMLEDHVSGISELLLYVSTNMDARMNDLASRVTRLESLVSNIVLTSFCKYLGADEEEVQRILISYLQSDPSSAPDPSERTQERGR